MLSRKITPDLELRLLQLTDAPALFTLVDANRAFLREWLVWVAGMKKTHDAEKFITTALQDYDQTRAFTAGVWFGGRLVGAIGHNRIDWAHRMGNPGWWLVPDAQGRGIMTQCCRVVFDHAFNELQLARICVGVATGNLRGQAFVKRLGFTQVSTLKKAEWLNDRAVDHLIYSLSPSTNHTQPASPM